MTNYLAKLRGRHSTLLAALVVLFLLYPVMVELGQVRFFRIAFAAVLASSVYSLGGTRRHLWTAVALAFPAATSQVIAYVLPREGASLAAMALALVFIGYAVVVVIRSVLAKGPVTSDKIAGAISAYLLLGLLWAVAYGMVEVIVPGSFSAPDNLMVTPGQVEEYTFIYYSFVTLTTLGYGEISPVGHWSHALAWMEAVVGQLYLAILIARLVGLHIHDASRD